MAFCSNICFIYMVLYRKKILMLNYGYLDLHYDVKSSHMTSISKSLQVFLVDLTFYDYK